MQQSPATQKAASEGRALVTPKCPNRPTQSAVRNVNLSSAAGNLTESMCSGQTAEPQWGRKQDHISVLYTNARSLIPKRDELLAYVATEELDIIVITKAWRNLSHPMSEL